LSRTGRRGTFRRLIPPSSLVFRAHPNDEDALFFFLLSVERALSFFPIGVKPDPFVAFFRPWLAREAFFVFDGSFEVLFVLEPVDCIGPSYSPIL